MSFHQEKRETLITVIGNESCGKTTILKNICDGDLPHQETTPTNGCDLFVKEMANEKLHFWDISGNFRFNFMIPTVITSRTDAILLVYRKNNVKDLNYLWEVFLDLLINENKKIFLIETHNDIVHQESFTSINDKEIHRKQYHYIKFAQQRLMDAMELKKIYKTTISSQKDLLKDIIKETSQTPIVEDIKQKRSGWCCY